MPDPLSIASGALSVIGAALKCSDETWNYISDLKHAPERIQEIGSHLKLCRSTLDKLQRIHRKHTGPNTDGYEATATLTSTLNEFETTCRQLLAKLNPYAHKQSFWRRIRWRWANKDIRAVQRNLERQQHILNTLLIDDTNAMMRRVEFDNKKILQILRGRTGVKSVSDKDEEELSSQFDELEDRMSQFIGYRGSYGALSEPRSMDSLVATSWSPPPRVGLTETRNIASVLGSGPYQEEDGPAADNNAHDHHEARGAEATRNLPTQRPTDTLHGAGRMVATSSEPRRKRFQDASHRQEASVGPRTFAELDRDSHHHHPLQTPYVTQTSELPYHILEDDQGRRIAVPANGPSRLAPALHDMRSAPSLLDSTLGMTDAERRAHISGYLAGLDTKVATELELSRSAGSIGDRPYGRAELERQLSLNLGRHAYIAPQMVQKDRQDGGAHIGHPDRHVQQARTPGDPLSRGVDSVPRDFRHEAADEADRTPHRDANDHRATARRLSKTSIVARDEPAPSTLQSGQSRKRPSRRDVNVYNADVDESPRTSNREMLVPRSRHAPTGIRSTSRPRVPLKEKSTNSLLGAQGVRSVQHSTTTKTTQLVPTSARGRRSTHSTYIDSYSLPTERQRVQASTFAALEASTQAWKVMDG